MSKHMPVPMNRMQFRMNAVRGMFGRKHMVQARAARPTSCRALGCCLRSRPGVDALP